MAEAAETIEEARRGAGFGAQTDARAKGRSVASLALLWPYARRRPLTLILVAVFLIVGVVTGLSIPLLFQRVVDAGFGQDLPRAERLSRIDTNFAVLLGVAVLIGLLSATRTWIVSRFGERVSADLRTDLYARLLRLPVDDHARLRSGEAVARLTADVTLIQTFMTSSASMLVRTLLNTTGALVLLLVVNWRLGGLLLLILPLAMLPLLVIGRRVRKQSNATQGALADAGSEAAETLDAVDLVKAYQQEPAREGRFAAAVETTYRRAMALAGWRAVMIVLVTLVFFGGVVGILWLGARAVAVGDISPGALSAMVLYALFAASGFGTLSEVYGEVMRAAGAADRAADVFARHPEALSPPDPGTRAEALRFEAVSYRYQGAGAEALSDFTLSVAPGEFIALVGPSGAGKSTVFRLALRFVEPETGQIRLGDRSGRDTLLSDWRAAFSYVPQDAMLFTGSVRDNLAFARPGASDADMRTALGEAQALDFVEAKGGLDADLGKLGKSLSGGQRQRIALARAFLRRAPVLLLDEATSALDSESEAAVQAALEAARGRHTLVVIAHRLSTVRRADRIVVMDDGRVVDTGTHTDLAAKDGVYARLAKLQFDEAEG